MAALDAAGFGSFIEFDYNSAALIPSPGLNQILKALTDPPLELNEHITITGHTDGDGSDAYNMDLSLRRANAVRAWLIENGARPDALRADGRGKREPIADNITAEGKRKNRRVEFSAKSW
jgi:outer membrane protein OmpA-like peptidoglycan-associated protein